MIEPIRSLWWHGQCEAFTQPLRGPNHRAAPVLGPPHRIGLVWHLLVPLLVIQPNPSVFLQWDGVILGQGVRKRRLSGYFMSLSKLIVMLCALLPEPMALMGTCRPQHPKLFPSDALLKPLMCDWKLPPQSRARKFLCEYKVR